MKSYLQTGTLVFLLSFTFLSAYSAPNYGGEKKLIGKWVLNKIEIENGALAEEALSFMRELMIGKYSMSFREDGTYTLAVPTPIAGDKVEIKSSDGFWRISKDRTKIFTKLEEGSGEEPAEIIELSKKNLIVVFKVLGVDFEMHFMKAR